MVLPFCFPARLHLCGSGSGRGEEPGGVKGLRLIQIRLTASSFDKKARQLSTQFAGSLDGRFEFKKRGQFLIGARNETLSVATMCVKNVVP
jgi:hypothetical protein